MYIYIIILLFCYILTILNNQNVKKENKKNFYKVIYILIIIFFVFIVGLRSDKVGMDTIVYKGEFFRLSKKNFSYLFKYNLLDEIGYAFLNILFGKIGLSWLCYKIFMASLFIVPVSILIYKNSNNCFFSLVLFIILGWLTYSMSTMRQAVAIGLTIIAFLFEKKNKKIMFFLFSALAISFHNSTFIIFIYYIFLKMPLNKNNKLIWLTFGFISVVLGLGTFRTYMFKIFNYFGKTYGYDNNTGGNLMEIFLIVTLIIGAFFINKDNDEDYIRYYKAIFLAAILLPIIKVNPALFRVYQYFSIYQIIFIPMMLSKIKEKNFRLIGYIGYNTVFLYLFFAKIIVESNQLIPYKFFWM